MKPKIFYTLIKQKRIKGAVKVSGFQFQKGEFKFYAYESEESGIVHIVDPDCGLSFVNEYMAIEFAENLISDEKIEKLKEFHASEDYRLKCQIFNAYVDAAIKDEQLSKQLTGRW